jgi:hypothetical protein
LPTTVTLGQHHGICFTKYIKMKLLYRFVLQNVYK